MVKAIDVSKLFLAWANENGDLLTNLKLQKLLYYSQAWHLVNFNGRRLFSCDIEAWEFGPVVPDIYRKWKKYRASAIPYQPDGEEGKPFGPAQIKYLDDFFKVFSNLSATALVSMSHSEAPWQEAWAKGTNSVISPTRMKEFYKDQYEKKYS